MVWEDEPMASHETLIVIDFEATCSNDDSIKKEDMEIIEFAAAAINPDFSIDETFSMFVQPVVNPFLTDFCTNLTTITQDDVKYAPLFPAVLNSFHWFFLKRYDNPVFCSWGAYDKKQLMRDCKYWNVEYPFDDKHINLKEEFAKRRGWSRGCGMAKALRDQNLELTGVHHRGIDDVKNISKLLPFIFGS